MKKLNFVIVFSLLIMTLESCHLIGDIFKVGAWAGALVVIAVFVLIVMFISRVFGS